MLASVRIDKWLIASRFFKTREIAIDAINARRVYVNDERVKPAKSIKVGDVLLVRKPPYEWRIVVTNLAEKRVAAKLAETFYRETEDSVLARESLRKELADLPPSVFPGRPTKKDRRVIDKFFAAQNKHDDAFD
ncbi:MAG: RNA-binding S4 domain-containing protein [Aeromicrobium sp.]|nr:RNA-binding S4 domain-containing protein [Burkholderiales bacterium]